jgi:hypothetical protein
MKLTEHQQMNHCVFFISGTREKEHQHLEESSIYSVFYEKHNAAMLKVCSDIASKKA